MTTTTHTCTVRSAVHGVCGLPAFYVEGELAECEIHARVAGSLYKTRSVAASAVKVTEHKLGDRVEIRRHGKVYLGTVVYVGARGRVEAEVTYGNGAKRVVKVEA